MKGVYRYRVACLPRKYAHVFYLGGPEGYQKRSVAQAYIDKMDQRNMIDVWIERRIVTEWEDTRDELPVLE